MPRVAFERGGVTRQHPLSRMADAILDACEGVSKAPVRDVRQSRVVNAGP
jgi:chemotaxis response regulator CheB